MIDRNKIKNIFGAALVMLFLSVAAYPQEEKLIDWTRGASDRVTLWKKGQSGAQTDAKAVKLISFMAYGKSVLPGKPFSATGDWLKYFTVKLKNISGKRIASVRMDFGLPEAILDGGMMGFMIESGETETVTGDQLPKAIEPEEEFVLIRSEIHANNDSNRVKRLTGNVNLKTVIVGSTIVKFTDGDVWMTNKLPHPN
jgi:hypothetical protein